MSNQYKLAIAAYLLVPMVFSLADGETETKFNLKLQAKRLDQSEWRARFADTDGAPTADKLKEVMLDITTGWRDQMLVLDESGAPATFCTEALEAMFGIPGLFDIYVQAYLKEAQARVKN
ncbi:hypothetical protein [Massilia sp. Root1485]|uniref:hypothetical protein n=1 Tax=Massilia sp. Root1485 TaxID=1736472 RepID=UPI0007019B3E|nr:hypothetical protein [Massilia sp. Root1485]KQZ34299.1 hypothetical protein ASD92_08270 [Massilia sp. Root1485]